MTFKKTDVVYTKKSLYSNGKRLGVLKIIRCAKCGKEIIGSKEFLKHKYTEHSY